jgi:hypothetical protein
MADVGETDVLAILDDGLLLRRANLADREALIAFHAEIHRESAEDDPNPYIAAWVGELLSGQHPTVAPGDFTVVTTAEGRIVSSLCLISQTWSFGGVPVGVGRIELVSTHLDYRRRGLVRHQMNVVHEWSSARGELIQGITGIPNFYRQFGYEMALDLGAGRVCGRTAVPALADDANEPYRLRPATAEDVPFLLAREEQGRTRWLVTAARDAALWHYELERTRDAQYAVPVLIITDADGTAVGSLAHIGELTDGRLTVVACELIAGLSWLAVAPSLLRILQARGDALGEAQESGALKQLGFNLGGDHPLYHVLPERQTQVNRTYAWYLRVPDLPAFLRHIAPMLEERLASSLASGHTGELLLNFYNTGLRLGLTSGRLTTIEGWTPADSQSGSTAFPGLTFLQLVVGYRTLSELEHAFADCQVMNDEARVLLTTLFPKLPSRVWPID